MRQVYLDYSATTPVKKEVLDAMIPYFTQSYGNPSSLYTIGLENKNALSKARKQVADLIGAGESEIIFTGCGTESDNWTVLGVTDALAKKGNHVITTAIEHHAMLHSCEYIEKHGCEVTYLPVSKDGRVDPADLEAAITDKTVLVSVMMVNNEIGTIEPIKELAAIAHKHGIPFHTDAVQALGNVPIDVNELGVDFLSMSAHKIYGPKGVGALYVRKGSRINTFMHGGGQENKRRAGTENVAGIVGFGKAAEMAAAGLDEHIKKLTELRDYLIKRITTEIPDVILNGSMEFRHPGNVNVTFKYIEGESMLLLLDSQGIAVSTGSACSSASLTPSHVLTAIGVPDELIHGSLRLTVGDFTTKDDLDYAVDTLKTIVARLRDISPVSETKGW